ncbi:MAG: N-6 DNA methylase, partial [Ruminiclostridium sp.]|nr:N-6 DNA methylase [Ruminiclostridium sp.]
MEYLRTAANNYKYRFKDQVLIYAQKPDATACAEIETWNKLGRWVNKGTKGIALLVDDSSVYRLRHVFDISDTNSRYGYEVKLWRYRPEYKDAVLAALEDNFGEVENKTVFEAAIGEIVRQVVQDNAEDYIENLKSVSRGSGISQYDDTGLEERFKALLENSIAYQVLTRCGIDAKIYYRPSDFICISDFDTPRTLSVIGDAVSDISEMILREIETTVRSVEKDERENRIIAKAEKKDDNEGINKNTERSDEHGTDLQTGGRLSPPESSAPRSTEDWEIWDIAQTVPQERTETVLHGDADDRRAEGRAGEDRPRSDGDGREADERAGEESRSEREPESEESDGVGTDDELTEGSGGGDSPHGAGLQLSGHDFNKRSEIPYYYDPDAKNELLRTSYALRKHRKEIAAFFEAHESRKERGDFIRSYFDNTFVEQFLENRDRAGYRAYQDVLHIWRGSYLKRDKEDYLPWWSVADCIYGQILLDTWLSPEEHDLPSVDDQISFLEQRIKERKNEFTIPQAAIDYVLAGGSGVSQGKLRIYEQFEKQESTDKNIVFLKNEYGIGGRSDAIPGSAYWEEHDSKGIKLKKGEATILIPWNKAAKRIGELIAADRYLTPKEKEAYPEYKREREKRNTRNGIAERFNLVVHDFNDFEEQLGNSDILFKEATTKDYGRCFGMGERVIKGWRNQPDVFILPAMREVLNRIITEDTHLTERAQAVLDELDGELAKPFEPTEEELNPPPEPEKEYRFSLGDPVYIGTKEYEITELGDPVILFDPKFPLLTEEMPKDEFMRKIAENPLNDKYLVEIENAVIGPTGTEVEIPVEKSVESETDLDRAKRLINEYCQEEFSEDADFSDLSAVGIAHTTVGDMGLETQVNANLVDYSIDRYIAGVLVDRWLYLDLNEMCGALENLDFNELTDYTDRQLEQAEKKAEEIIRNEETAKPEAELAPPAQKKTKRDLAPHILYPEIKSDYRTNFTIKDDKIGVGTPLERFYHNITAISLLHKLEGEHRLANTVEQSILSDYVGWGGLSEFCEETNPHYGELKKMLTDEEYASARESSLTAFFTPPVVIRSIYKALENMGFKNGNILEPSCGIGNFMGLIPDSMSQSKIYGVELDSVSGRIAQQLYQKNNIAVQGFESTELPDSFFDAAVGNVPFGQFKVSDKRYDKLNFNIHDYFFAKTLDKVRPGGVMAFITSRFTMDKADPTVRKYIAQRADLLGAIRLPNNTFKDAAGTDVTTDIIFLQKRDRLIDAEPDWVHLNKDENGITMNQYFIDNPDMIVGEMKLKSGPFGPEPACIPYEDQSLEEGLNAAVQNIHAEIPEVEFEDAISENEDKSIPADPSVRNFSYTVVDGKVYYRINSRMDECDVSVTAANRIKGMIKLRDCVRELIEYQMDDYPDEEITGKQKELNELYDEFIKKYGYINSRANSSAFNQDNSYYLLTSLERFDDDGKYVGKADMFSKRTIRQRVVVTSVDTASEALALSLAEKTKVDMEYMCSLTGKTEEAIADELKGVIFLNPLFGYENSGEQKYIPADEYLSGNIRSKLALAKKSAELDPEAYSVNVKALEQVMPKDLSASEISVRLGSTWLPVDDINDFMWELFGTSYWMRRNIHVHFAAYTGEWSIEGKSNDRYNVKSCNTYGTDRVNGYKILEETLNLRDVRVFDYVEDDNGRKVPVLNKKETAIAQGKQQLIKEAFSEWIWKDPNRRERLTKLYNEKFNSTRPREYDGSHLNFIGMNPEITLRPHQVNAIAHILYGGNTLLAHVVGAGKTYEMVAAAQEMKRLGLCRKSLFVVPNHLTEQWASEYLQLYPSANILVASKRDFETKNRKKFCGRIATGDYDAVIIGHSQFEKIPMSVERQISILQKQEQEILEGIDEAKRNRGENFTIKQMEKARKAVRQKLDKLNDQSRKDDVVTFEELGVDRLFIDEAHYYKNLAVFTKMRNVGGIAQTEAMKSSDLYMKCRCLDELTGGRGVVFATGTPISNSMVEMYTMQKYLQYHTLEKNDLIHFDSWASTFGETVTAIELAPEGNGYRAKTRFAKFYNLPELMSMFKEVADVQTADMLDLPVPKAVYHNVALKPSEQQKEMVKGLSERAEKVRNRMVNSSEDNMLCITNDGRKLALDQRLINELLPDSDTGKVTACADNVYEIWERTKEARSTQLVFCDLSTPKNDGHFNVYDDLKAKLIAKGIPEEEIAFVHSAETEQQKSALFGKVKSGNIRVLIGSTQKMGAGTNVQKKLIAL